MRSSATATAAFLNRVWTGPEMLPTLDEIRNPERWIARVDAATLALPEAAS